MNVTTFNSALESMTAGQPIEARLIVATCSGVTVSGNPRYSCLLMLDDGSTITTKTMPNAAVNYEIRSFLGKRATFRLRQFRGEWRIQGAE